METNIIYIFIIYDKKSSQLIIEKLSVCLKVVEEGEIAGRKRQVER